MRKRRFTFSTTQIIMLSFIPVILIGSVLLSLPISSADGNAVPFVDALFTATSATCVTGLVTVPTVTTWSLFGQAVLLVLIQMGGLGVITVLSGFMILIRRRIGLADRVLIKDVFNLDTMSGLVKFVKKVIFGTLTVEGIGALLYMTVFVPEFGLKGIWISVFNSVSAFCNAGIDIVAENSLCNYALNPIINIVTCALIITGGIGFIVWWDVIELVKNRKNPAFKGLRGLTLHSKIALSSTLVLIFVGAAAIFVFEYNNPLTLKDLSFFEKIETSIFQSVTTRTAGFATLPQENLSGASAIVCLLLMFIGGSPVGTAGGVKTVTVFVLLASTMATVKNKEDVTLFNRTVSKKAVSKAVAVTAISFMIMFVSTVLLSAVTDADILDVVYETVSATATVGLTRNLTPMLNIWGKLIIIVTMYLGRIGPISLVIAFAVRKEQSNIIKNPVEKISVG